MKSIRRCARRSFLGSSPALSRVAVTFGLATLTALSGPGSAGASGTEDWPSWRGATGQRSAPDGGVFDAGRFGLGESWGHDLGPGYSAVSIAEGVVVAAFSDGERDRLAGFDVEGRELWRYDLGETYAGHDGSDDGPLATPTISDGSVFFLGAHGRFVGLDLRTGKERFRHEVAADLGGREPDYGFTSSPLVVDGVVVVQGGGDAGRSILAFDRQSGERRWALEDDRVAYQSPTVLSIGGVEQVLAVTNRQMLGIDPKSGDVFWSHQLAEDDSGGSSSHPIPIGENRVLLTTYQGGKLFEILATDGLYAVNEVWDAPTVRGHAIPVYHDGHLYGYTGNFLTCVDAATGETVWKSRPPGSGMLIGVGDRLVVQTDKGEIVVAKASPEGYVEEARLELFEPGYPTAPSFAGGRIYARSPRRLASVSVTTLIDPEAAPTSAEIPATGAFGEWIAELRSAEGKESAIEEFLDRQESFPILEEDRWAHFVYRGEVEDLVVSGNFSQSGDLPMGRVEGTDLYYRSVELDPASIYVYGFREFERFFGDPLNDRRSGDGPQAGSIVTTAGWEDRPFLESPSGKRGAIEEYVWESESLENERTVAIYLPVGYAHSGESYPLLVVHLGDQALGAGKMANALDHLIGETMAPVVAAFVPRREWAEYAGSRPGDYAEALRTELLPHLEETYRIETDPMRRGTIGVGSGAFAAIYTAFHDGLFGRAGAQSFYRGDGAEELDEAIQAAPAGDRTFYIHWSRRDYLDEVSGLDAAGDSRELADRLSAKGYETVTDEVGHGPGWEGWGASYDRLLSTLFPPDGA